MAHVPVRFDGTGLILPDLPASAELPAPRALNPPPLLGPNGTKSAGHKLLEQQATYHGAGCNPVDEARQGAPVSQLSLTLPPLVHIVDQSMSASRPSVTTRDTAMGDGPVALIRFSQNPSGSRRFLVSRSGHVYVARGLQVTGMVAGSMSNFIQHLLA